MRRGRMLALAALLTAMVCGGFAAQADAFVYWPDNVALGRANLDGSGVNQNLIGIGLGVFGVAVDGQHVFWTDSEGGAIGRANLDGSGANKSFTDDLLRFMRNRAKDGRRRARGRRRGLPSDRLGVWAWISPRPTRSLRLRRR